MIYEVLGRTIQLSNFVLLQEGFPKQPKWTPFLHPTFSSWEIMALPSGS